MKTNAKIVSIWRAKKEDGNSYDLDLYHVATSVGDMTFKSLTARTKTDIIVSLNITSDVFDRLLIIPS